MPNPEDVLRELLKSLENGTPCVLATLVEVRGSAPRHAGTKALILPDGSVRGSLGGGRFESLAIEDARACLQDRGIRTRTYPLHENDPASFGAVCGGEVTVLFEPHWPRQSIVIVGAGHCGAALARMAQSCGWHVTVVDDRTDLLDGCPAHSRIAGHAPEVIGRHLWLPGQALVLVSRNHELDRDTLAAALRNPGAAYIGMMGSRRKVARIREHLTGAGVAAGVLDTVDAPVGLDIGAETPAEIAISILGGILARLRKRPGATLSGVRWQGG